MEQNPDAADNLLPQRQAEELMAPVVAKTVGALVCKGDSNKLPSSARRHQGSFRQSRV